MTKKEKQQIKKAIDLINSETGYHQGMEILCNIAGLNYYFSDLQLTAKKINLADVFFIPPAPVHKSNP